MSTTENKPQDVALLGLGTVGLGWAANYLAKGFSVRAYDPAASAGNVSRFLASVWPSLKALGLTDATEYPAHRLTISQSSADAVRSARFIHENGPESIESKCGIYVEAENAADPDAIIASSSGGLPPSILQSEMRHPERFVIAHPFNPAHLVPLVEVLGGAKTDEKVVEKMISHLRRLGKHPIKLQREMPGYLTNRLQFALLREAIYCLVEGVASAASIEDAVKYGLAPRWMVMGSLTTLTLAGGEGGMQRMLESFSGAIDGWWAELGTPRMTSAVKAAMLKAENELTHGQEMRELAFLRDENLVSILQAASNLKPIRTNV